MLAARDAEQEAAMLRTRLAEAGADAEDARAAEREKLSEVCVCINGAWACFGCWPLWSVQL